MKKTFFLLLLLTSSLSFSGGSGGSLDSIPELKRLLQNGNYRLSPPQETWIDTVRTSIFNVITKDINLKITSVVDVEYVDDKPLKIEILNGSRPFYFAKTNKAFIFLKELALIDGYNCEELSTLEISCSKSSGNQNQIFIGFLQKSDIRDNTVYFKSSGVYKD